MTRLDVSWVWLAPSLLYFLLQGLPCRWENYPTFFSILFVMLCVLMGGWLGWLYHYNLVVKTYNANKITFRQYLAELGLDKDKIYTELLCFAKRIAILNTARLISREQAACSEGILLCYVADDIDEVRLVSISTDVPVTGEILPFRFHADPPDIPYQYTVILIHPDDWNRVVSGDLKLPPTYENPLTQVWPLPTNENSDLVLTA